MFYKILHKPTGLYFKPSKYASKSNPSKKGKVYQTKPSFRYLGDKYHHPAENWDGYDTRPVVLEEWEIIEIRTTP